MARRIPIRKDEPRHNIVPLHGTHPIVDIITIDEDGQGPFALVQVSRADQGRVIRWGLDHFTYLGLVGAIRQLSQGDGLRAVEADLIPRLHLSLDSGWLSSQNRFLSWVQAESNQGRREVQFFCSELYAANLEWLRGVSSLDELEAFHPPTDEESITPIERPVVEPTESSYDLQSYIDEIPVKRIENVSYHALLGGLACIGVMVGSVACAPVVTELAHPTHVVARPHQNAPVTSAPVVVQTPAVSTVWRVPPGDVALTFSGGPSADTVPILHILQSYHVRATFYFVGNQVRRWPQSVAAVARAGDTIGDRSMSNPIMTDLPASQQAYQIGRTRHLLTSMTGQPVALFEPPYGIHNAVTDKTVQRMDMTLALWNRDPRDWSVNSARSLEQRVLTASASGGILVFDELPVTLQALPAIIQGLQREHLRFVVVSSSLPSQATQVP